MNCFGVFFLVMGHICLFPHAGGFLPAFLPWPCLHLHHRHALWEAPEKEPEPCVTRAPWKPDPSLQPTGRSKGLVKNPPTPCPSWRRPAPAAAPVAGEVAAGPSGPGRARPFLEFGSLRFLDVVSSHVASPACCPC